jgi:perosamine synthetase
MKNLNDSPIVKIPQPHFEWGLPTKTQANYLLKYIRTRNPMSIYGDGGINSRLEKQLCKIYSQRYCVLTNTGTSALNSGYFGLNINPGDEVIVPTYTFLATVTPLLRLGAKIVFCDADSESGNIDPLSLERRITKNTKVVAITHMWGIPCDMDSIMPIIKKNNLKLLEDCSHAHFTRYKGKLVGTFGDVSCFSIGAKKTMTCGEGGFLLTSDPEIFIRAILLGHFNLRSEQSIELLKSTGYNKIAKKYSKLTTGFGENYRIHPYAAVMANAVIETGEIYKIIKKRKESLKYFIGQLQSIENIEIYKYCEGFFQGAMFGFKPKLHANKKNTHSLIKKFQLKNAQIKLPDTGALHNLKVFQKNILKKPSDKYPGASKYLTGRISVPTFSSGMPKDKIIIDQYCEVMDYVLNK